MEITSYVSIDGHYISYIILGKSQHFTYKLQLKFELQCKITCKYCMKPSVAGSVNAIIHVYILIIIEFLNFHIRCN